MRMRKNISKKIKRRAGRYGRFAESLCALSLRIRGYRIRERDYRTPVGEVDLIASRGRKLVFVEVKARQDLTSAAEALGERQKGRILRAANYYLSHHPELASRECRFDVMLLAGLSFPRHLENAFQ